MLIKYKVFDEDNKCLTNEIATFSEITYDNEYGLCFISFAGDFDDIVISMDTNQYNKILNDIFNSAVRGVGAIDISYHIAVVEDYDYDDEYDEHYTHVKKFLSEIKKYKLSKGDESYD